MPRQASPSQYRRPLGYQAPLLEVLLFDWRDLIDRTYGLQIEEQSFGHPEKDHKIEKQI